MIASQLFTVNEAAARLRLSPFTVRAWIKAGRLKVIRLSPRGIRISAEALADAIEHQNAQASQGERYDGA